MTIKYEKDATANEVAENKKNERRTTCTRTSAPEGEWAGEREKTVEKKGFDNAFINNSKRAPSRHYRRDEQTIGNGMFSVRTIGKALADGRQCGTCV